MMQLVFVRSNPTMATDISEGAENIMNHECDQEE